MRTAILIGANGKLGRAICHRHQLFNQNKYFQLIPTSRSETDIDKLRTEKFDPSTIKEGDIILLAIPGMLMPEFAEKHREALKKTTIVDCSNDARSVGALKEKLAGIDCSIIKAFTKINVHEVLSPSSPKPIMPIAGDNTPALEEVRKIIEALGFHCNIIPNLEMSEDIVAENYAIFPKWRLPLISSLIMILAFSAYTIGDRNLAYGVPWNHQLPENINAGVASTALNLLACIYMTGAFARMKEFFFKRKLFPEKDKHLISLLNRRKEIGLLAVGLLTMHMIYSTLFYGTSYSQYFNSQESQLSLIAGITGYCIFPLLVFTSIKSVGETLGMKEWMTIQSRLGKLAFLLGVAHLVLMDYDDLITTTNSGIQIPSIFTVAMLFPVATILIEATSHLITYSKECLQNLSHCSFFKKGENSYNSNGSITTPLLQ